MCVKIQAAVPDCVLRSCRHHHRRRRRRRPCTRNASRAENRGFTLNYTPSRVRGPRALTRVRRALCMARSLTVALGFAVKDGRGEADDYRDGAAVMGFGGVM